ncbi:MAG: MlaA family lipoprotein [Desulfobulbales bacterium]
MNMLNRLLLQKGFVLCVQVAVTFLYLATYAWAGADAGLAGGPEPRPAAVKSTVDDNGAGTDAWDEENWEEGWEAPAPLADPLEPLNRLFFHFNDKFYYWVLKPVAKVYAHVFPLGVQIALRNFFVNLRAPARAVNNLLQGNVRGSGVEVARFVLNSTLGVYGFGDFAGDALHLQTSDEDLGQTFGYYGAGGGFYINWPFLGPSNFRDSIGMAGDTYLYPLFYVKNVWPVIIGVRTLKMVNRTALTMGDYEMFTSTALDPYTAVKDAYQQYRNGLIQNK